MMMIDDPQTAPGQQNPSSAYVPAASQAPSEFDQAVSMAAPIKDAASDAAAQAKDQVSSLAWQAKDKALATANEQKAGLADRLDDIAAAVHKAGEQFTGQQDWIASAIERGAVELGSLASSLRESDVLGLLDQVKMRARRQPALFVGVSLAAGFAVARLGKVVAADVSRDDLPTIPEVAHAGR